MVNSKWLMVKKYVIASPNIVRAKQSKKMKDAQYYIYIMTNQGNTVLYTGVTNNLIRRVFEHKEALANGFTKKYRIKKLVYFENCSDVEQAIVREKQIKGGSRQKKKDLINQFNPRWDDLYDQISN